MFTGIIRHVGVVRAVRPGQAGARVTIDVGPLADGLDRGDSVAVSGACLTAAACRGGEAEFDVVPETLARTTLGALRPGAKVNLERALALGSPVDGHLVQGHVDGVAVVRRVRTGPEHVVELEAPGELIAGMVPKGSVAVDGVSLTLVAAAGGWFSVALIPITLAETTLGDLAVGQQVNIETDLIGKYVLAYLREMAGGEAAAAGGAGVTLRKLREAGFA